MRSDSDTARALLYSIRCGLSGLLIGVVPLFSASASTSDGMASIDAREQQRQQERERALQQQNAPQADARLSRPDVVLPDYSTNERPCFIINRLTLVGESADRFQWALNAAADARGRCLGSQGIVLAQGTKRHTGQGLCHHTRDGAGAGLDHGRIDADAAAGAYR
ncbi:hypothetical protein PTQ99_02075 [Serratia nevei]